MILAFCRGKGFVSALVRWQTWSKYSHVAIVTPAGVYEACVGKGVIRRNFWDDTTGIDFFVLPTLPSRDAALKGFLEAQVGKKYDWLGALRFLTRRKRSNTRWFCSELAFEAAQYSGVTMLRGISALQVSPGTLSLCPMLRAIDAPDFSKSKPNR